MRLSKWLLTGLVALLFPGSVHGFGGEDLTKGKPWHHRDITLRALSGEDPLYKTTVTFGAGADAVAWHSEYIDSYLYSPLFWGRGLFESSVIDRTRAALVGYNDLAKLHFDDTFTGGSIEATWERYASGTLAGLYWASEQGPNGDVAAGHHILGISFHAVQDFYAHSNWVSAPHRRCQTYFQTDPDERRRQWLFTGAYATARSNAPAIHGNYSLSCSLLRGEYSDEVLDLTCAGFSPLQNTSMCERWRECGGAVAIEVDAAGIETDSTVYLEEPGIALDSLSYSRISSVTRGLTDRSGSFVPLKAGLHIPRERCTAIVATDGGFACELDSDFIFAGTKDLAIRATIEWAEWLETAMIGMGKGDYWERLKNEDPDGDPDDILGEEIHPNRYAQFEDFTKLPYQFLAAGPYPRSAPSDINRERAGDSTGWYLRLRIKTADKMGAGTDADISAIVTVDGRELRPILLDYLPTNDKTGRVSNPILVFNDFEMGADDTYTIGPFASRPESFRLRNDAADYSDILEAATRDFVNGTDAFLTSGRQFLIGIVGGNADYVGWDSKTFSFRQLENRLGSSGNFEQTFNVRSEVEGKHDIIVSVQDQSHRLPPDEAEDGWKGVEITLKTLKTIEESDVDRGSDSDEPFVIFRVVPLNGKDERGYTYLSKPFDDMDDGEEADFPRSSAEKFLARIPEDGAVVMSVAVYESDDESREDRRTLRDNFVTGLDESTRRPALEILDAFGRAALEDWTPSWIEAYAFERGAIPQAGPVLDRTLLEEIAGDEDSPEFMLDWSQQKALLGAGVTPILQHQGRAPNAREVLEGEWFSEHYWCEAQQPYQKVNVTVGAEDGSIVQAFKTEAFGDNCVGAGEPTFRGEFRDGVLTGERRVFAPPYNRPKEVTDPPNPLDPVPNFLDRRYHPRIDLEGNWMIGWSNSAEPPAFATLKKGGTRACVSDGGGCWWQFKREHAAPWNIDYYQPGGTINDGGRTDDTEMGGSGAMTIDWDGYQLIHGGAISRIAPSSGSRMSGKWYLNQEEEGGVEIWQRIQSKVTEVGVITADGETRYAVGEPIQARTEFRNHIANLHGNRDNITLRLYGTNLWGVHYGHLPWSSDLELMSFDYVCAQPDSNGGDVHSNWKVCMDRGGVVAIQTKIKVWWRAESKRHILHFDGIEIPIDLEVVNEPIRGEDWQDMKMEFRSCNTLQEVDRDFRDRPFKLIRRDFKDPEDAG